MQTKEQQGKLDAATTTTTSPSSATWWLDLNTKFEIIAMSERLSAWYGTTHKPTPSAWRYMGNALLRHRSFLERCMRDATGREFYSYAEPWFLRAQRLQTHLHVEIEELSLMASRTISDEFFNLIQHIVRTPLTLLLLRQRRNEPQSSAEITELVKSLSTQLDDVLRLGELLLPHSYSPPYQQLSADQWTASWQQYGAVARWLLPTPTTTMSLSTTVWSHIQTSLSRLWSPHHQFAVLLAQHNDTLLVRAGGPCPSQLEREKAFKLLQANPRLELQWLTNPYLLHSYILWLSMQRIGGTVQIEPRPQQLRVILHVPAGSAALTRHA